MQFVIEFLADGLVIPLALLAGYMLLFRIPHTEKFDAYCRILMAGLTAYLIAKLVGAVYQPADARPFELLGIAPGASYLNNPGFPSDHALFTAFLTLAVWFETKSRNITIILAALTLLVGIGRVLALVHSPLDVAGGFTVAALGALWYLIPKRAPAKAEQSR